MDIVVNSFTTFGTFLQGNLAPLLTVFGWFILLVNTDRIALRNESRSSIDLCIKKIDDLMALTTDYHNETEQSLEVKYRFEISASSIISTIETKRSYLKKRTNHSFISEEKIAQLRMLLVPSLDKSTYEQCIDELMDTVELLERQYAARFGEKWHQQLKLIPKTALVLALLIMMFALVAA